VKRCKHCGITKSLNDFYSDKKARDGRRPECKACNLAAKAARNKANPQAARDRVRRWREENPEKYAALKKRNSARPEKKRADREGHLKRKYGITLDDYERMLEAQGGVCFICKKPRPEDRTLHVDHDHATGEIRGLLCFRCNNALGDFDDDYELLQNAADYLDRDAELDGLARERATALMR
jgi:hypothetical protein